MADNNIDNTLRANHLMAQTGLMIVPSPENPGSVSLVRASTGETVVPLSRYNDMNHLAAVMTANSNNGSNLTVAQGQAPSPIIRAGSGNMSVNGAYASNGLQFTYKFPKCSEQRILILGDQNQNIKLAGVYSDGDTILSPDEGFTDQQNPSFLANTNMGTFFTGKGAYGGKPNLLAFLDLKGFVLMGVSAQITDKNVTCTILDSVVYYKMQRNQKYAANTVFIQNTFTLTAETFAPNIQRGVFSKDEPAQIGASSAVAIIIPPIDGPFQITFDILPTADWAEQRKS